MDKLGKIYLIHNVSYWPGNKRDENLLKHINYINNLKVPNNYDTNLTIISIMYDNKKCIGKYDYLNKNNVKILYWYNSGGTVKSMWNVYKYLTQNSISSKYFTTFEDDVLYADDFKLEPYVNKYLDNGYIFVGALYINNKNDKDYNDDMIKNGYKYMQKPYNKKRHVPFVKGFKNSELIWCEDPYIMYFKNLKIIEDNVGKFTLAPNTRYDYAEHGINYGEVGFPTRLYNNGMRFFGIQKKYILKDLNNKSIF